VIYVTLNQQCSILVAGTLMFPYNYAMAGRNHDVSNCNCATQTGGHEDHGNVGHDNTGTANIGNGNHGTQNVGNGNSGSNNVGNGNIGNNYLDDLIPGICV
jgi:hypothetical protein